MKCDVCDNSNNFLIGIRTIDSINIVECLDCGNTKKQTQYVTIDPCRGDPKQRIYEVCPNCNFPQMIPTWKFCPGCGIKVKWALFGEVLNK